MDSTPPPDPLNLPQVHVHPLREFTLTEYEAAVAMLRASFPRGMPAWGRVKREGWDVVVTNVPSEQESKREFAVMGCKTDALYALIRNVELEVAGLEEHVRTLKLPEGSSAGHVVGLITQAAVDTFFPAAEARYAEQSMLVPPSVAGMAPA